MDRPHRLVFDRIRSTLSAAIPKVSPNPGLRRRLYGALVSLLAIALGTLSSEMIHDRAIAGWLSQNPPVMELWEALAKRKGLSWISESDTQKHWSKRSPKSWIENSAWWNETDDALWVISSLSPNSEAPPKMVLFARRPIPPTVIGEKSPPGELLLGQGWEALRQFEQLAVAPPAAPSTQVRRARNLPHPKLWNF